MKQEQETKKKNQKTQTKQTNKFNSKWNFSKPLNI